MSGSHIYTLLLYGGIFLLCLSLYNLRKSIAFMKKGSRATATVIENEKVRMNHQTGYSPVFKFTTNTNQEIICRITMGATNPPNWNIGEETEVVYDPENPKRVKRATFLGLYRWTIIPIVIAIPSIIVGLYFLW